MFDKLIESDAAGAEFKDRSRYFLASSIVVGILFLTAVVYSLYAGEIGLGNENFDIAELQAPLETVAPETTEPRRARSTETTGTSANPNSDMARTDEPTIVPTSPSSLPNTQLARTWSPFDPRLPETTGTDGSVGGVPGGRPPGSGSDPGSRVDDRDDVVTPTTPPPPVIARPTVVRTSKLLNGSAIYLPKPAYPRTAGALGLEGSVTVQVMIDETGSVISARSADGHPFFKAVAEQAARGAKFKPTILNDVPVKVTGVIVYRFRKN